MAADVAWRRQGEALEIDLRQVAFSNADLRGKLDGSYRYAGSGAGVIDLNGGIDQVKAARVPAYLPHQVGEHTTAWLRRALLDGVAKNVTLKLKGDLDRFPFGEGGGEFLVEADVEKAKLAYEPGWPTIDGIDAKLRFHNASMQVLGQRASTVGVPLKNVVVAIDQLGAETPWLKIDGMAEDRLDRMLAFTGKSPVDGWLDGFTSQIQAAGDAGLKLQLAVPLAGPETIRVRGDLSFRNNRLQFKHLPLPEVDGARGVLTFTERGVDSKGVQLNAFGGQLKLTAHTGADKRMRFEVGGEADGKSLLRQYLPLAEPLVSGRARVDGRFVVKNGLESLQIDSALQGLALDAPAPLGKAEGTPMPLQLQLQPASARFSGGMRLEFSLGDALSGKLRLDEHGELQAGALGLGRKAGEWPAGGLAIRAQLPRVALEDWWSRLAKLDWGSGDGRGMQLVLDLSTPELSLAGFPLRQVEARVSNNGQGGAWNVGLHSKEADGSGSYQAGGGGELRANLDRLSLNWPLRSGSGGSDGNSLLQQQLPAMKVRIGELSLQGRKLGQLDMTARRSGSVWLMDPLRLSSPDGALTGSARVDEQGAGRVDSRFSLDVSNAGKLLERFGLVDVFRNGQGNLSGQLSWPGGLSDLDAAHLSGQMELNFKNGRFAKVDPGVARLLGVLSLQSLPRRIRLDFTDVFSDGFAFDTLQGKASVRDGVFRSDKVEMRSPAAEVSISGSVDLAQETQALRVSVQPHVAESVALAAGAALLNPVVGIATLAAQKVLQDPVGKILKLEYTVSGSLRDPQVKRVGAGEPVQNKGKKP
ncbi:TIGR02099 family protein [Chromobacterium alticapitis]|uniref:TIGR02099 family protein n=1 Tax=Chromobacterium alticapitis TaxID=2073169 RepID=A0A2S5DAQ0_9NEIS|nr:TIGR02099 family protein [Chromobacterium alticapitis]